MIEEVKSKARAWLSDNFDPETRERVKYLMDNDEKELIESFYKAYLE
ncbi:MAG: hypothetical protein ACP5E3_12495 [Bacteroidales bacterium]